MEGQRPACLRKESRLPWTLLQNIRRVVRKITKTKSQFYVLHGIADDGDQAEMVLQCAQEGWEAHAHMLLIIRYKEFRENKYFLIDLWRFKGSFISIYLLHLSRTVTFNIWPLTGISDLEPKDFKASGRCSVRTLLWVHRTPNKWPPYWISALKFSFTYIVLS